MLAPLCTTKGEGGASLRVHPESTSTDRSMACPVSASTARTGGSAQTRCGDLSSVAVRGGACPDTGGSRYSPQVRTGFVYGSVIWILALGPINVACSEDGPQGGNTSGTDDGASSTSSTSGADLSSSRGASSSAGGNESDITGGAPQSEAGSDATASTSGTTVLGSSGTETSGTETRGDDADGSTGETDGTGEDSDTGSGGETSVDEPPFGTDPLEPNTTCTMQIGVSRSEAIETVATLRITTDLGPLDAGYVDFGPDESYGFRAPLRPTDDDDRAVLLGMTQSTTYHYRVVAKSGDRVCASDDATLVTGAAPAGVPTVDFSTLRPEDVAPGFLLTSIFSSDQSQSYALISNHQGELVWWYHIPFGSVSRVALDDHGRYLYARDSNEGGLPGGRVVRIAMDGSSETSMTVDAGHHDLSIAPEGVLFLTGGGTASCGRIQILTDGGNLETIFEMADAFPNGTMGGFDPCHCNSIRYNAFDDSITVSCLYLSAYVKVGMEGSLHWVLGGDSEQSHFSGDISWNQQHGHHLVSPTRLVFFNNAGPGELAPNPGGPAYALELDLDLDNMVATRTRTYEGQYVSAILGDAQILPNESLLMTFSASSVIQEIDPTGEVVAQWEFPARVGYANHHPTLYAPAPRR